VARELDRTAVTKVGLDEQTSDAAYWRKQSPEERLATLESIRREYHDWPEEADDEDLPRLQRVCRIRKRS
jgi:hypothetical protein